MIGHGAGWQQVQGEGIRNIYKVNPLINLKIPVGHTLNPHIEIFNPHDHVLSVKEVFTNEGFLHLKLPKGAKKGSKAGLWEIAPMTWSKVMSVSFHSTRAGRHIGFVHVRTNVDTLIVPLEVHVMKGGVHRWPDLLDFETLTSAKEKTELNITVLNSTPNPLLVTDVVLSSPDPLLQINLKRGTVLQANSEAVVATVLYSGRTEGRYAGRLVVRTNDTDAGNKALELPYQANVLHGRLSYSQANASFPVNMAWNATGSKNSGVNGVEVVERWISLTNEFSVPVHLLTAVVEDAAFEVVRFPSDQVLLPRGTAPPIVLRYSAQERSLPASHNRSLPTTSLAIHTNVSIFKIALNVYHGRLSIVGSDLALVSVAPDPSHWSEAAEGSAERMVSSFLMDMGALGVQNQRVYAVNITNSNPVPVDIYHFQWAGGKVEGMSIELVRVLGSDGKVAADDSKTSSNLIKLVQSADRSKAKSKNREATVVAVIKPGHMLCLEVLVRSQAEEKVDELLRFHTNYEVVEMRMRYVSMLGSLKLDRKVLELPPAFPGKIASEAVYATSTFKRPFTITDMSSSEARIQAVLVAPARNETGSRARGVVLEPGTRTLIGHVRFDPSLGPANESYMASAVWKPSEQMKDALAGDGLVHALDLDRMENLSRIWDSVSDRRISASIVVKSDMVQGVTMEAAGTLEKPDILSAGRLLSFPLTQLGQASEQHLSVENPSDLPMLASLMMAPSGTDTPKVGWRSSSQLPCQTPQSCVASSHFLLSREQMAAVIVPPRSWASLGPVFFVPKAEGVYSATAYVRTNLTFLHSVGLRGEGGSGKLEMSEGAPGTESCDVLRLDVVGPNYRDNPLAQRQGLGSEASLPLDSSARAGADGGSARASADATRPAVRHALTITKVVTLSNSGSLPIKLYSLVFSSGTCEWQGLKINECDPAEDLEILPSSNVSVRLSFTPDCTFVRTHVDLVADTSIGTFKRKVEASVSRTHLEACYRSISRAGAGSVLQGARHAWLCASVVVFLVALCVLHVRWMRLQAAVQARLPDYSQDQPESKAEEAGKPSHAGCTISDQNRAKAMAHLERMRSPGPKEMETETVLQTVAAASGAGNWGHSRRNNKAAPPATASPSLLSAKGRPAADAAAAREKQTHVANPAAALLSAGTSAPVKRGGVAKKPAGLKTLAPAAAAAATDGSSGHSLSDSGDRENGSWKMAGAAKPIKQTSHRDKDDSTGACDKSSSGPPPQHMPVPGAAAQGVGLEGFPPVTGTFDMVKDPVYPLGAAAAWSLQDRPLDSGQVAPLMSAGAPGGLALFGSLDTPFTHAMPSHAPVWPGGAGLFSAMPCDPAQGFPASPSVRMLGSPGGLLGGDGSGIGVDGGAGLGSTDGGVDGGADFDFVFRIPPHMPAADFPLED